MCRQIFAMMSDGVHEMKDYVTLAKSDPSFNAVGQIYDQSTGAMQTCVLIRQNTVLTAAHGVIHNKNPKKITVTFDIDKNRVSYRGASVDIDPRYLNSPHEMIDFGIITLEKDVEGITPVTLQDEIDGTLEGHEILCVTYGNKDIDPMFKVKRRAFYLPEISTYYYPTNSPDFSESVALSSLFIAPQKNFRGPEPSLFEKILGFFFGRKQLSEDDEEFLEAEIYQRLDEGYATWKKMGKPPFALALPGSSGAPVFIKHKNSWVLLGMITSFAHLASPLFEVHTDKNLADLILSTPRETLYGHFQTVFTTLYKKSLRQGKEVYTLDKTILEKSSVSDLDNLE